MREMTREKLRRVQQKAHDQKIWVRSQKAGGKLIPNLDEIAEIWGAIENLSKSLQDE